MTYYKLIRDGAAYDANCLWLKWYPRHKCLIGCEPNEANYVCSYDGATVYRAGWLNPLPEGAPEFQLAECKIIDEQEYLDLRAQMDEGETVPEPVEPEPEPEPEPMPEPEPEPEPETPMTVKEMREKIQKQEDTIVMLTECLLEISEILYGGDLM